MLDDRLKTYFAPTTLVLYLYTHILDQSKHIIHLCNMLHELKNKFINKPHTVFTDYHAKDPDESEEKLTPEEIHKKNVQEAMRLRKEMKDKLNKKRIKHLIKHGLPNITTKRPKRIKGDHEVIYGWSIEDYWWNYLE